MDAERLFGPQLVAFMHRKGHAYEAKYIEAISNWRIACDRRGLTELERCRLNHQFLNLILDELMPWHHQEYDFSLLEVNRYMYVYYSKLECNLFTLSIITGQSITSLASQEKLWLL